MVWSQEQDWGTHADLSWKIHHLEELQRGLHRECNSLKNQITFISSLANKLLGVIFQALAFKASPKSPPTENILSHVSQWFRSIATNTRLLWTQINILQCLRPPLLCIVLPTEIFGFLEEMRIRSISRTLNWRSSYWAWTVGKTVDGAGGCSGGR